MFWLQRLETVSDLQHAIVPSRQPYALCQPGNRRTTIVKTALIIGVAAGLASSTGCGGESRFKVAPVRGRVTYHGTGVREATVIFHPSDDAVEKMKKMRPYAYADGEGNFALTTYLDGDGAPLGKYRVSIIAVSSAPASKPQKDKPAPPPASGSTLALAIPPEVTKKYGNVETSGIEVTVHEGENNLEPFAL
jgi:hypothetical protein